MSNIVITPTKSKVRSPDEREALFQHLYLLYMDTAYYNAYAIDLGYPDASHLPSHLAYPPLPRPDLTIEPRQRVDSILALINKRFDEWQEKTKGEMQVVDEIERSYPDIWKPDKLDKESRTRREWEEALESCYSQILDKYRVYRKCSTEEKKEFRKAMIAAAHEDEE